MADKPILFSAPMVRALLAGTKTQTRRTLKAQPTAARDLSVTNMFNAPAAGVLYENDWIWPVSPGHKIVSNRPAAPDDFIKRHVRIAVGDRLWVREAFLPDPSADADEWDNWTCSYVEWSGTGCKASQVPAGLRSAHNVIFKADPKWDEHKLRFTIGRFMPRWASRITLTVTDVRVQRLQDISEDDAIAEGIGKTPHGNGDQWLQYPEGSSASGWATPVDSYRSLWDQINGAGAWALNPWVAAYTFTVALGNIDSLQGGK